MKKQNLDHIELSKIPLGYRVRDRITGFEGIAIAKVVFLNGCVQYHIKPTKLDKETKMLEACSIDCQQLEVLGIGISSKKAIVKPPGGNMPDSPKIL